MADKKSLIKFCRYYDGSKHADANGDRAVFIDVEQMWIKLTIENSPIIMSMLSEYMSAGLRTFEMYDDTPATLKAALFSRFAKYYGGSLLEAATAFKAFYKERYMK